jgi:hypothetical protein
MIQDGKLKKAGCNSIGFFIIIETIGNKETLDNKIANG